MITSIFLSGSMADWNLNIEVQFVVILKHPMKEDVYVQQFTRSQTLISGIWVWRIMGLWKPDRYRCTTEYEKACQWAIGIPYPGRCALRVVSEGKRGSGPEEQNLVSESEGIAIMPHYRTSYFPSEVGMPPPPAAETTALTQYVTTGLLATTNFLVPPSCGFSETVYLQAGVGVCIPDLFVLPDHEAGSCYSILKCA